MIAPRLCLVPVLVLACYGGGPSAGDAGTSTSMSTTGPDTTTSLTAEAGLTTGEVDAAGDSGALTSSTSGTSESFTSSTSDAFTTTATTGAGSTGGPLLECPEVADPVVAADIDDEDIDETSGLVASRTQPGVFWLHNDSGDEARFFAVDAAGQRLGVFNVGGGASAVDWEDMSSGPGPNPGEYLYFGDIGDNAEEREDITIYRVPEPDAAAAGGGEVDLEDVDVIELVYPDAAHNAETMMVDPQTGDLVIVGKGDPTRVFVLPGPLAAGGPYMLAEISPIDFSPVIATGGDISPGGEFIAVRTYTVALLWLRAPGTSIAEAFAGEPCKIPLADEIQGETLTFAGDGSGYYTLGEGSDEPLYWYGFH